MKKLFLLMAVLLLGVKDMASGQRIKPLFDSTKAQEVFVFGTNKSQDGYITAGFTLGEWGLYGGLPYTSKTLINTQNGSVPTSMRFGIIKRQTNNKLLFGIGAQPTTDGTKLHSFVGYNPLKSKDMKLWLLGNVTGSLFSFGAGLSYVLK